MKADIFSVILTNRIIESDFISENMHEDVKHARENLWD